MAITWNPNDKTSNIALSEENLRASNTGDTIGGVRATDSVLNGKWYWEVKVVARGTNIRIGIATAGATLGDDGCSGFCLYNSSVGKKCCGGSYNYYGSSFDSNDVIGVAFDTSAGKIWFAKNNVWQDSGDPASGTGEACSGISGTYFPYVFLHVSAIGKARFLSGDQAYEPPTGFKALDGTFNTFDGKVSISPKTIQFDGKTSISPKTVQFDGKSWVTYLDTNLLDGRVVIKDVTTKLFDGRSRIKDTTAILLDGKAVVKDTTRSIFDGKATIYPIVEGNIEFPLIEITTLAGATGSTDLLFPGLEGEAFTGVIGDLDLPIISQIASVSVGKVAWANIKLSSLNAASITGARFLDSLDLLECNSKAYVGSTAIGKCDFPIAGLNATAVHDIIAILNERLPLFTLTSGNLVGVVLNGNLLIYPLHVNAYSIAGAGSNGDITLGPIKVLSEAFHDIIGYGEIILPVFYVPYSSISNEGECRILRYNRWE